VIAYPAKFVWEEDGITVTFPDLPEIVTAGYSEPEALQYAVDAMGTALTEYINRRRAIPKPSKARGKGMRLVALPALAEAKLRLYEVMRRKRLRKADLARRMGVQASQIDRLLDLNHSSRLEQVEDALRVLDKRLVVSVANATLHAGA
jgi:antitoxin HicB